MDFTRVLFAGFFLSAAIPLYSASDDDLPPHRDGTVLVKFRSDISIDRQKSIVSAVGGRFIKHMGESAFKQIGEGVSVVNVGSGRVSAAIEKLKELNFVLYVEPDYRSAPLSEVRSPFELSGGALANGNVTGGGMLTNDPGVGLQWALQNTGQQVNGVTGMPGADERAVAAWSATTGTNSVVIAVLDTGVQYSHPDLWTNMWNNAGGINGCAAGTHGYNVLTGLCDPMDDDSEYNGHGSHVAGILGAVGNNGLGVSGLSWTTSIMAVKWVDGTGAGFTSDLISAMDWVINAKHAGVNVRVVNDSQTFWGTAFSEALSDEIDLLTANDILFVTAAGNTAENNDTTPRYPCSYDRPGMICTAASDQNDNLWMNSNFGAITVKLAAPGANIYSTLRSSDYGFISGCSMAAAQVSATAALILSYGYLPVLDLRSTILSNVDPLSSLTGLVATGGRLNACNAVPGCSSSTAAPNNLVLPAITGVPDFGSILGASTGIWSGLPVNYAYQWYRCETKGLTCNAIPGATSETYGVFADADSDDALFVSVTASNSAGMATAQSPMSRMVTVGPSPFNIDSTILDGNTITGSVLWQANPSQDINFAQFYVDGVVSRSVSSAPYVYGPDSIGRLDSTTLSNGTHVLGIRALSSATNRTYGFRGATVTIANPPQTASVPVISGNATQGQTITVSNGSWSNNPSSFKYSWNRCDALGSYCNPISGATASSYLVAAADVGAILRASVTATNAVGSNAAQSAPTPVVTGTLNIVMASLPGGGQSAPYSATLAATGGTAPYSWSITAGALPDGLSLAASTGIISGTPTASGTSNFTVTVTDSNSQAATQALSLTITPWASDSFARLGTPRVVSELF